MDNLHLPEEIIRKVCLTLRCTDSLADAEDFKECTQTLLSLVLVNKVWNRSASEALYHTISITGHDARSRSLSCISALWLKLKARHQVKRLSILPLEVTPDKYCVEGWDRVPRCNTRSRGAIASPFRTEAALPSTRGLASPSLGKIYSLFLSLCPQLHSFRMGFNRRIDQENVVKYLNAPQDSPVPLVLPSLLHSIEVFNTHPEKQEIAWEFLFLQNVRSYRASGQCLRVYSSMPLFETYSSIETLQLSHCEVWLGSLCWILSICSSIRNLIIEDCYVEHHESLQELDPDSGMRESESIMASLCRGLRKLVLRRTWPRARWTPFPIGNLSKLARLETLEMACFDLLGPQLERLVGVALTDLLPQSLSSLTLYVEDTETRIDQSLLPPRALRWATEMLARLPKDLLSLMESSRHSALTSVITRGGSLNSFAEYEVKTWRKTTITDTDFKGPNKTVTQVSWVRESCSEVSKDVLLTSD